MEPVRLSHRDRGPPAPPLRLFVRPADARGAAGSASDEGAGDEEASSSRESTALRRLDEDRLLAALLADGTALDLGKSFSLLCTVLYILSFSLLCRLYCTS
jgi:hypothetical protein